MRVLALGYPLPSPQVDNYPFLDAPSFFDYDAIAVDPASLSRSIEDVVESRGDYATRDGRPVVAGPSGPWAVGLADTLYLRREETARLLARGGVVVCLLRPNVVHQRVPGFSGCDRYYWLPAPAGLLYREPQLLAGYGRQALVTDHDHPFAAYVAEFRQDLVYYAYFADNIPGFASFGRVFARSTGGAAIGLEIRAGGGTIVFLPSAEELDGQARIPLAQTLLECIDRLLGGPYEEGEPPWVSEHDLPGLRRLAESATKAELRLAQAREEAGAAALRLAAVAKYRAILWQEGRVGLVPVVLDGLRALGFRLSSEADQPLAVEADGLTVLLEVEGSREAVNMDPHYRLRRRREEELARSGRLVAGLLVINGYRLAAPGQRPQPYIEALRVAAESMRYCLLTTEGLFQMVRRALAGASDEELGRFRRAIVGCEGVLDVGALVGEE